MLIKTLVLKLFLKALEAPLRQIVDNGGDDASVVLNEVRNNKGTFGYNAGTGEYGDMIEMGILRPNIGNTYCIAARGINCEHDHHY